MRVVVKIVDLSKDEKDHIRALVTVGMKYLPNSHFGAHTRREDMRHIFQKIRKLLCLDKNFDNMTTDMELYLNRFTFM